MGSPFEDFTDLYGTSPAAITAAAHTPGVHASQLSQLGTDLLQDAKKTDAATVGDLKQISAVGQKAAGHAQTLAAAGQLASGCLLRFGADGADFDTKVAQLNEEVANAAVGAQHDPDVRSGKIKIDVSQLRKDMEAQLRPTYNGYVHHLDSRAHGTAALLKGGPGNLDNIKTLIREGFIPLTAASDWPGLKLTTDDINFARASQYLLRMQGMTPDERAAFLVAHTEIPAGVLDSILHRDADTANVIVTAMDSDVTQINDGKWDDLKGPLGDLDKYLGRFGTLSAIAAPFMNKIGPDGLLRLNQIVAQSQQDGPPDPYARNDAKDGGPADDALAKLIGQMQKDLGNTLGVASGGPDGYPPDTPAQYRLNGDFVDRLNQLGQQKQTVRWPGTDYDYGVPLYGYQVLAPILSNGHYSTDFLHPLAEGMYDFDRYHGDGNGSVWMDTTVGLPHDSGVRIDWTHGTGSNQSAGFDPLQGLMRGLANNPDAARDFFTDERTYSGTGGWDGDHGYNDKVRYLLNERQWNLPGDQSYMGPGTDSDGYFHKDLFDTENNRHAMAPLGAALTAAADGTDQSSATLFGDIVHEVANGDSGRYADIRNDFATMAAHHLGAVNGAFIGDGGPGPNGDIDPVTPGVQYDPGLNPNSDVDLEKYLAEIGRDGGAKDHLTAAEALYMQAGYHQAMSDPHASLDDRMTYLNTRVNTPMGHVLGALDYGNGDQTYQDHQASDQEHNDAVDEKYKIIGFITDKLPFDKIPVAGSLVSSGVDSWLDALKDSEHIDTTSVANTLIGNLHSGSENHLQSTAETTLLANLSAADRKALGVDWPTDADGHPKPMSTWTAADQAHINQQLDSNPQLAAITQFGQNANAEYAKGYSDTQTDIKSH